MRKKLFLIIFMLLIILLFKVLGLESYLSLDYIQQNKDNFVQFYRENPFLSISFYILIYIFITAASLPLATILSLLGGAIFGTLFGTLIACFAATVGATCAFLLSRTLFKNYIEKRFKSRFVEINRGVEKDGVYYLMSLRLMPIVPFFIINFVMGLTKMKLVPYFIVSYFSMLPGAFVYVNAGKHLGELKSLEGIFTPGIFISLLLVGLFPILIRKVLPRLIKV